MIPREIDMDEDDDEDSASLDDDIDELELSTDSSFYLAKNLCYSRTVSSTWVFKVTGYRAWVWPNSKIQRS